MEHNFAMFRTSLLAMVFFAVEGYHNPAYPWRWMSSASPQNTVALGNPGEMPTPETVKEGNTAQQKNFYGYALPKVPFFGDGLTISQECNTPGSRLKKTDVIFTHNRFQHGKEVVIHAAVNLTQEQLDPNPRYEITATVNSMPFLHHKDSLCGTTEKIVIVHGFACPMKPGPAKMTLTIPGMPMYGLARATIRCFGANGAKLFCASLSLKL